MYSHLAVVWTVGDSNDHYVSQQHVQCSNVYTMDTLVNVINRAVDCSLNLKLGISHSHWFFEGLCLLVNIFFQDNIVYILVT